MYSTVFMLRRLLFAAITVLLLDEPNLGLHIFIFSNAIYIVYFGTAQPHDSTLARRLEYFNEVALQLTVYHFSLFPLAVSLEDEKMMGWSMIGFVGSIFIFNLGVILVSNCLALKRKLYLRRLKKKQETEIALMKQ